MTNRRQFIKNASLATAAGMLASQSGRAASFMPGVNNTKNFGLQTYSLGGELGADVPGGLKRVAAMGYQYLELAGYNIECRIGQVPMAEFKRFADDAGIEIRATHTGMPRDPYDRGNLNAVLDHWKRVTEHHVSIGCKYIIQPGDPGINAIINTDTLAYLCELYNEIGKVVKAGGGSFGFHNHAAEFRYVVPGGTERLPLGTRFNPRMPAPEGAVMLYDGMLAGMDPEVVFFELDVYWCVFGQQCPVEYMQKYPKRFQFLHIKDRQVLGESGWMNFQKIFETAYADGIQHFVVELEGYTGGTQFEGVKGCADYLLRSPFVR